ncbi:MULTISPECIES: GspE/PulE family protein [Clostridium]|uniref:ATPase, T2SS/T4P/T4SS family n=1 Tax=Clostridium nitritogenes TaxID=83340 RepID=A0ABN1LNQ3_9CLOT|nr:ATPase, T2SS/T4P/T4SS family [Clostridium baratii]AQM59912.1 type II secretion system protein GspE [Clostridium baratii]KJU72998.1 type II secretion system protein E [Clostridium baratii]MBT9831627.1 type II secretion system protein GspE [Clostridium baratii]MDY3207009.1 ATPase, T2SS/T4P/T4SS family [Clostridium baratii]STA99968.1 type II secretion system protein E [Clostridium baratii]
MKKKKRLGDLLVELGYITQKQVDEAIKIQKSTSKRLGRIFVEQGLITEESLMNLLELQLGIPRIDLESIDVNMTAVTTISEGLAKKYNLIPVKFNNGNLVIAMSDPLNVFAEEDVALSSGYKVEIGIASEEEIRNAIAKYYSRDFMEKAAARLNEEEKINEIRDDEDEIKEENSSPAVKLIDRIIENAVRNKVSDIHIEPQKNNIVIRYRIDGRLKKQFEAPKEPLNSMVTRIKLLSGMDISERRIPQDGKILSEIDGKEIDLRVSILPSINGENLVIRILDKTAFDLSKVNLGLTDRDINILDDITKKPYGMLLVTGPTGSGKTSTLYSLLKDLKNEENNIITLEDPVEYSVEGIVQVNVNTKAGLNFSSGLRAILRQDPDIIMVGEIRDEETATMAMRSAITGHTVLSTLHTNDAASTIIRLLDMEIPPYLICSSLTGVVAQRLSRKLCDNCKEEYLASSYEKELLGVSNKEEVKLYKAVGCSKCSESGYKGRTGIFEIMVISQKIKEMIYKRENISDIRRQAIKEGMRTLFESGRNLVLDGKTSINELMRITVINE